jgi:hypothetical protein
MREKGSILVFFYKVSKNTFLHFALKFGALSWIVDGLKWIVRVFELM